MILNICENPDILKVVRIVKIVINIFKIVIPIMLLLALMIDFMKAIYSKDDDGLKKASQIAVKRVIACILIFFIPTFVSLIMRITASDLNYSSCFTNANKEYIAKAYVKQAEYFVELARKEITDSSYGRAHSEVMQLTSEEDRERLLKELEEIKKKLDEKHKKEEEERKQRMISTNTGWWFPVGGKDKTIIDGKGFATGEPVTTRITATFAGNDSVHRNLGKGGHGAIDIGAGKGTYVIASKSGTVVYPKANSKMDYPDSFIKPNANGKYDCTGLHGNYVEIDHGGGIKTQYYHLLANSNTVKAGDVVQQGQIIGLVGSSGCSTNYHLHFAVFLNGTKVDPLNFVSTTNTRP